MIETDQEMPALGRLARRTVATCTGALENRAELLALEFEEENDRMLKLLLFTGAGLFLGMMTALLTTGIIIYLTPEEDRIWAALGFAVLYLAGTIAAALFVRDLLKRAPFAESLNQIRKDADLLDAFK